MKDKNEKKHGTLKIQMPISYCVCPGIQKERDIRTIKERYWGDIEKLCEQKGVEITEAEACPDYHTYVGKYPTPLKYITVCGISQGKK